MQIALRDQLTDKSISYTHSNTLGDECEIPYDNDNHVSCKYVALALPIRAFISTSNPSLFTNDAAQICKGFYIFHVFSVNCDWIDVYCVVLENHTSYKILMSIESTV
ncbi:unnamed protein product [Schistosoma curassoni]|uniref:Amine oxidase domain-containing protein n=1 Tax=Schistosoma curassoni TaxID=6186 RepID=A0A183KAN9_9TREM|nr:unnamed protein product [Schistosoma curassoni]